jgi:hypothetical protein
MLLLPPPLTIAETLAEPAIAVTGVITVFSYELGTIPKLPKPTSTLFESLAALTQA